MTATTVDRNTRQRIGSLRSFPVKAATTIPAGCIACLDASGLLVNGAIATTLKSVGVPQASIANTGADGAIRGEVEAGVFGPFANSTSTDAIALADVGADCYVVDNQTVAKTSGGNTRSVAGKVWDVSTSGVWVKFG